jgi:hypothetical protein
MRLSALLLDLVLCACFLVFKEKRCIHRKTLAALTMCAGIFWLAACGGSGGSGTSSPTGNSGTPTGSYTLTLSAVSGSGNTAISHNVKLTLVVD